MAEFILKDQYGKEKTFDHDKIFVMGTDGELIQFSEGTGDAPAVVQPLEVTENGTYTTPDGVDGYSPVTVAVPEPEINLQDKTITENGTYSADSGYDGLGSVTVEVAGPGGGSLPAGFYWKQVTSSYAGVGGGTTFFYSGTQYVWTKEKSSSTKYSLYRYENDQWTLALSDFSSKYGLYYSIIEFGGVMHFLGGDSTSHLVFDGATCVNKANLPNLTADESAFVLENTLYIKTKNNGIYKWVEASDTWEAVSITGYPTSLSYESVHVYNGNVYIFGYRKLYKITWSNLSCEQIESTLLSAPKGISVGKYLYIPQNWNLQRYDFENKSASIICYLPVNANRLQLHTGFGNIGIFGTSDYALGLNATMHEVTE